MTSTTSIQDKAQEAHEWFEVAYRVEGDEDSSFVRTKDGTPEWVKDLVYTAHGEFLPDNWRYGKIRDALGFIADADDPADSVSEFADDAVDVYTGARVAWLASNLNRAVFCDEAANEYGGDVPGIVGQIGLGQYYEAQEIYQLVLSALEAL